MALEITPLRLIMFTAKSCIYCPPIESILHEVVGVSGMNELIHVSTIDVDLNPAFIEEYNINALPMLVINEEVVLQGGMMDDEVREILWATIMKNVGASQEIGEKVKVSLLNYTMSTINSLNGSTMLRPSIGDYTHIGTYQQNLLSLYSLDPLIPHLVYRAGQKLGKYGITHHILTTLNPKLGRVTKRRSKFIQLARALELYFSNRGDFSTLLAESASVVEFSATSIHLKVNNMASAAIGVNVGEPMCGFTAGQLAGVTSAVMGTSASCDEQICLANGGDFCLFKISIDQDYKEIPTPAIEDKYEREKRRETFYEVIHEITEVMENSLTMRNTLRPNIGDFVHISVLQPIIISLKLLDKFTGLILYSGGRELGVGGPGKELLWRLIHSKDLKLPVEPDQAIDLLYEFLSHPTSYLSRDYGKVSYKKGADKNTYLLEVNDMSTVAGMSNANLGDSFCDFKAGFFAGRLLIMLGTEPTVREIQCQGKGHPSCVFEITLKS
jgi:predicted hydrocarbon binding protein